MSRTCRVTVKHYGARPQPTNRQSESVTFILFLLITLGILTLVYGYTGWRLITPAKLSTSRKAVSWSMLIFFLLVAPTPLVFRANGVEGTWLDLLAWLGYLSLGFFSLVFPLLIALDFILLAWNGAKKSIILAREHVKPKFVPNEPVNRERRRFLVQSTNLGIVGISGVMAGYGLHEARRRADIEEIVVPILHLPSDLEGFRIAQFTDIHVGPTVKRDYVQTIAEQVNGLEADVIAFTGDLVDGSVPRLRDDVAPLKDLYAHYGTFFITGNHEYYSGAKPWIEKAESLGFTVLLNEHRVLQRDSGRIILAGTSYYSAGQFISSLASFPEAALSNAPPGTCEDSASPSTTQYICCFKGRLRPPNFWTHTRRAIHPLEFLRICRTAVHQGTSQVQQHMDLCQQRHGLLGTSSSTWCTSRDYHNQINRSLN